MFNLLRGAVIYSRKVLENGFLRSFFVGRSVLMGACLQLSDVVAAVMPDAEVAKVFAAIY